jgi:hypothetical protein
MLTPTVIELSRLSPHRPTTARAPLRLASLADQGTGAHAIGPRDIDVKDRVFARIAVTR